MWKVFLFVLLLVGCGVVEPAGEVVPAAEVPDEAVSVEEVPAAEVGLGSALDYNLVDVYNFPVFWLTSELHPFEQERELWHDAFLSDFFQFEDIPVRLRGRGNSTWWRGEEKRPLRIRFEEPQTLLGSEHAAADWVLIANLFDLSLLRNHAAFYLADSLDGMDWAPFSRLVHLYINGEYYGVYQLADERDVGPGRAQLTFDVDPAVSEYFFEMDGRPETWLADGYVEDVDFFVVGERAYAIRFPHRREFDGHLEYLRDFVRGVDAAVHSRDLDAITAVLDLPSFVDFYLVQELFKNIDSGYRSVFLQVRGAGADRRLYHGPVWDFDRSAGNTLYWTEPNFIHSGVYNIWFRELLEVPAIKRMVIERWNEIQVFAVPGMLEHLDYLVYNYGHAFERNFERHVIFGTEPEWFAMLPQATREIDSFQGQAAYLMSWFRSRVHWLDTHFNGAGSCCH